MPKFAKGLGLGLIIFGVVFQIWIAYGHFHRVPFEQQFVKWFDGVNWNKVNPRNEERDGFSYELYDNIRSVQDAVDYINNVVQPASEEETLAATHRLVSDRFVHYMYPHHTWVTNPIYALLELVDPRRSFNEMATASELLRHSAAGACGDTSTTFLEVYRALGGEAQYVQLDGHHLVEARVNGRYWLVDADKEALGPYGIEQIKNDPDLVDEIYTKRPKKDRRNLKSMFSREVVYSGYTGVPYYGAKMYYLHKSIEVLKWVVAPAAIFLALVMLVKAGNRRRGGRVE